MQQFQGEFPTPESEPFQEFWGVLIGFMPDNGFLKDMISVASGPVIKATPASNAFVTQFIETCERPEFKQSSELMAVVLNAACQVLPYHPPIRRLAKWFCGTYPGQSSEPVTRTADRLTDVKSGESDFAISGALAELENRYADEVATLRVGEVDVWPVIRAILTKRMREHLKETQTDTKAAEADVIKRVTAAYCSVYGHYQTPPIQFVDDMDTWETDKAKADYLFFSHVSNYKQQQSRYGAASQADFLCEQLSQNHNCLRLEEFHHIDTVRTVPRLFQPTYFRTPWAAVKKAISEIWSSKSQFATSETKLRLENFTTNCAKAVGINFDRTFAELLAQDLHSIEAYAGFFRSFLTGATPKAMFLDTDPIPEAMGMILACRSLKIPIVQLPRVSVGAHQPEFTHWLHVPPQGFNTQADFLWVGDPVEKARLENAFAPVSQPDRILSGGDPRVQWAKENVSRFSGVPSDYERTYLDDLTDERFTVLVKFGDKLSEISVLTALAKTLGEKARILARFDPPLTEFRDNIQQILSANGLTNVECVFASILPIELLLPKCHHVLTSDLDLARAVLEYDAGLTIYELPNAEPWSAWLHTDRLSVFHDLQAVVKYLKIQADIFGDTSAWTERLRSFQHFRQMHLPRCDASVSDLDTTIGTARLKTMRFEHSTLTDNPAICDEDVYLNWRLPRVPLPSRVKGKRNVVTVDAGLVQNRAGVARVLACAYSRLDQITEVDFVFKGHDVRRRQQDLLSVFSTMNAHPASVHIDASCSPLVKAPDCHEIVITQADLDGFHDVEGISLPHLTPSADTLKHARAWFDAQDFDGQTIAVSFSDWLSSADIERILRSTALQTLASQKNIILNGGHHLDQVSISSSDPVTLFEPAIYSIEAAVSLSHCVDTNVIVSDDLFDMVFFLNGNSPMRITPQDWH